MTHDQTHEIDTEVQDMQSWTAPTLTRLEMEDAEAGPAGLTDAGIFS
ncbi:hypothetical protein [Brevundimonas sp.]|nr:hypothetical protein [Brevundimonas sp.]MBL0947461.1 hypothetical protein [Brevundimonas sp.]